MNFIDGNKHVLTEKAVKNFKKYRKVFCCGFCGKDLVEGDAVRWIYTNDIPGAAGNPFICDFCDDGSVEDARQKYIEIWKEFRENIQGKHRHIFNLYSGGFEEK